MAAAVECLQSLDTYRLCHLKGLKLDSDARAAGVFLSVLSLVRRIL